ncbi:MAG: heme o synthase [Thermaerobacter sp.]|nr:heme o synthase [Thermaerobacter sp.]
MANPMPIEAKAASRAGTASLGDYAQLTKPRIILLLVITAYCAMVVAAHGLPPFLLSLYTLLGLALSAGGAHAVNMWYDRDIDAVMARTNDRPVPQGKIPAVRSLYFGISLMGVSLVLLLATVNLLTALLALGGFLYYVLIYTMWLKRSTPQNIVIGGGAGAFPPLIGWAAVTGQIGLAAVLMFLIIFLWTPPHFWALALYRQDDYRRAGVPMMPVVRGERSTKVQMISYAALLLIASAALYFTGVVGAAYLGIALALSIGFLVMTGLLLREHAPETTFARRTFGYSLLYLTVLFAAMVLNVRTF